MFFVIQITFYGTEMWGEAFSLFVHGIRCHCRDPARGKELVAFLAPQEFGRFSSPGALSGSSIPIKTVNVSGACEGKTRGVGPWAHVRCFKDSRNIWGCLEGSGYWGPCLEVEFRGHTNLKTGLWTLISVYSFVPYHGSCMEHSHSIYEETKDWKY